jgi:hypothetical protein
MQTNFTTIKTRKQHKQEQADKTSKQAYKGKQWTRDTSKRNFDG